MSNKIIGTIVVIAILVAAGVLWYSTSQNNKQAQLDTTSETQLATQNETAQANNQSPDNQAIETDQSITDTPKQTPPPKNNEITGTFSGEPGVDGPDTSVFEIAYDGTSFTPNKLSIKVGDVVIFKNKSSKAFWPASGPHPAHTNYPEFDPKKSIAAGQSWQFTFAKAGTWPYHDHLNSSVFGTITVSQ